MTHANPLRDDVERLKAMLPGQEATLRECDAQLPILQGSVDSQQIPLVSHAVEVEHA